MSGAVPIAMFLNGDTISTAETQGHKMPPYFHLAIEVLSKMDDVRKRIRVEHALVPRSATGGRS
jgi:hypothetical protein